MKKIFFLVLIMGISLGLFAKGTVPMSRSSEPVLRIQKKWSAEKVFKVPESVLYDDERDIIYVANINGQPTAKDGNGFISKLMTDGTIETLEWITGLNAPKGMGIFGEKLYVADIDHVVEIDIEKDRIVNEYACTQAQFLNDITVHSSGAVYVSDNIANLIFQLKNGKLDVWLDSKELTEPNGLWAEEDRLLIGIDNAVLSADFGTKEVTRFIEETDYIDGLVSWGEGSYCVSDFLGAIHLVRPGEKRIKIIDTTKENVRAADIYYIRDKKLLLVPTFSDNRVVAYDVSTKEREK